MQFFYAVSLALSLTSPAVCSAKSVNLTLLSALYADESYQDAAGECNAVARIEALLQELGVAVTHRNGEEVIVFLSDDPDGTPSGSIQPQNEDAARLMKIPTPPTIAARIPGSNHRWRSATRAPTMLR